MKTPADNPALHGLAAILLRDSCGCVDLDGVASAIAVLQRTRRAAG
jgi:hypothetical protein